MAWWFPEMLQSFHKIIIDDNWRSFFMNEIRYFEYILGLHEGLFIEKADGEIDKLEYNSWKFMNIHIDHSCQKGNKFSRHLLSKPS